MSFAAALRDFARQVSRERRDIWPVTVTPAGSAVRVAGAKSPTQITRVQQEQGAGWVQRAVATFLFPVTGSFAPDIGTEMTIVQYPTEVGTRWRCFDLTRGDANTGSDHRMHCYRLD